MTAVDFSAIAATISAACALFTLYMFRSKSKGFVWTKDHKIELIADQNGLIHLQIQIPLFNLGKGNIQFISLRAKKINMTTKAMENFQYDMDEAYFPEGSMIIIYRTAIQSEIVTDQKSQLLISTGTEMDTSQLKEYQKKINQKVKEIPEHIVILKSVFKDGSWFGKEKKETVIGLSVAGLEINYLSTARRKELNEYFAW
jgi:hypothetical protein